MRPPTARTRRIARGPSMARHHGRRLGWLGWLALINYLVLGAALLCAIIAAFSLAPAS